MDAYRIALFLHLCALLTAFATGSLLHFAQTRMLSARTADELRPWALLVARRGVVFPLALFALVATGAYMVDHSWSWSVGWLDASLAGVALLLISGGGVVGRTSRRFARILDQPEAGVETTALARDPAPHIAAWSNTGLALAITFVMVDKPTLAASIAVLAIGIALGALAAFASLRAHGRPLPQTTN